MANRRSRSGSNLPLVPVIVLAIVAVLAGVGFAAVRLMSAAPPKRPPAAAPASRGSSASGSASATLSAAAPASSPPVPVAHPATDQVVPVLMYHHVMPEPNNDIAITPGEFEKQMQWLADHGYHTVSIAQLTDFELTGRRLPSKPVLLTFDDGRMNQLTYAVPVMKKHGFTATFFVVKKWVESPSTSFMHVSDLRRLSEEGFDIQSHTSNHMYMWRVKLKSTGRYETYESMKKRLWYPTWGMRVWLSEAIGKPVTAVAYPGGAEDSYSPRLMKDAGYTTAFTTNDGVNRFGKPSPLLLHRYNAGARGLSWGSWLAMFRQSEKAAR